MGRNRPKQRKAIYDNRLRQKISKIQILPQTRAIFQTQLLKRAFFRAEHLEFLNKRRFNIPIKQWKVNRNKLNIRQ